MKLPKSVTRTMYVIYQNDPYISEKNRITLMPFDSSKYGTTDVLIGTIEVTFGVPQEVDVAMAQVEGLRRKRDEIVAKGAAEIASIDRQIQELLALPDPGSEVVA